MRRFGGGVAATLIYWLGTNSGERAAVNETRLPSARIVVQEQKPGAAGGTQVFAAAPQQDKSSATVQRADTEVIATFFVRGKRVALREGPGKKFLILIATMRVGRSAYCLSTANGRMSKTISHGGRGGSHHIS